MLIYPMTASAVDKITFIQLVSEEWEGATNSDGTGFYWDIARAVYEPLNIKVQYQVMPYARGVSDVETGKADAWVGSYFKETAFAIYPVYAFDDDQVIALFKAGRFDKTKGKQALSQKNVGWIRGYEYHRFLGINGTEFLLNSRKSGILMVVNDRLDFYLDACTDVISEFNKGYVDASSLDMMDIGILKLYMAFSPSLKGRQLRDIWDRRMVELHNSGELRSFYKKDDPVYTTFYPFVEDSGNAEKNQEVTSPFLKD